MASDGGHPRKHDATDRVLLASFDSSRLARIREYAPEFQTSLGQKEVARLVLASKAGIIDDRLGFAGVGST